jgi:hypothetical protein
MATSHGTGKAELQSIAHAAMLQRGLLPDFSPAVIAETNQITRAAEASGAAVRDLRGLLWASIDNDDSLDLDQLSVAEPAAGGAVKILVAIADVDALVKKDSAIDGHAWTNTTSVYTAGEIFPMLPEKLSTDLTSLGEGQERLAIVIEMVIARDGTVTASDMYRAVVRNRAKLAYNAVAAWLEGTAPAPPKLAALPGLDEQLRIQDRAAQALKRVRHANGALRLETLEVRAVFDDGVLADLLPDEKNRAKELIEDFMIAANGVTAKYLEKKGLPSLRRVLHTPRRWDRIVALAAESGERLPLTPDAAALDAFLSKRRQVDPAHFPDVSLSDWRFTRNQVYPILAQRLVGAAAAVCATLRRTEWGSKSASASHDQCRRVHWTFLGHASLNAGGARLTNNTLRRIGNEKIRSGGTVRPIVHFGFVRGIRAGKANLLDHQRNVRPVPHHRLDPHGSQGESARHHHSGEYVGYRPPQGFGGVRHR